ncbi:hypothetical protein OPU71_19510 [Niveibacterium sp. 24ML]|uniref:hypothetical protein n=1 Tax=Niveibacterium sp. 24ML TaxID=2985512 RepID=UPI002270D1B0|nr:hypothetical protein [Niveibacterium sp. 24ML]MCX9158318.1 hypothetical protein [Niveibacterium sp. 24ML]
MQDFFSTAFLESIPPALRDVPQQIRSQTGIALQVQEIDESFARCNPAFANAAAVLDIDHVQQAITIRVAPAALSPRILSHELIHLKRNVVESVPKFFPIGTASDAEIQSIYLVENALEHLFVVPEEIALHPESEAHWAQDYQALVERSKHNGFALCLHWFFLRIALPNCGAVAEACAAHLNALQDPYLIRVAEYLGRTLHAQRPDKLAMQHTLLKAIDPALRTHIAIGRFAIRDGKLVTERLKDGQWCSE